MKNFAFHSLLRWKMIILTNSHYLTYTFLFWGLGECTFWTRGRGGFVWLPLPMYWRRLSFFVSFVSDYARLLVFSTGFFSSLVSPDALCTRYMRHFRKKGTLNRLNNIPAHYSFHRYRFREFVLSPLAFIPGKTLSTELLFRRANERYFMFLFKQSRRIFSGQHNSIEDVLWQSQLQLHCWKN